MNAPIIELNWTSLMVLCNLVILYFILKVFFFEKIRNFMQARENAVKDAFDSAEVTNKKATEQMETYNKKIAQIQAEGRDIIRMAKAKADTQASQILAEASAKAAEMLRQNEQEIKRQQAKALVDMKQEVGALAILAAEKILEKNLQDTGAQNEIIDKILEEAGTSGWQN